MIPEIASNNQIDFCDEFFTSSSSANIDLYRQFCLSDLEQFLSMELQPTSDSDVIQSSNDVTLFNSDVIVSSRNVVMSSVDPIPSCLSILDPITTCDVLNNMSPNNALNGHYSPDSLSPQYMYDNSSQNFIYSTDSSPSNFVSATDSSYSSFSPNSPDEYLNNFYPAFIDASFLLSNEEPLDSSWFKYLDETKPKLNSTDADNLLGSPWDKINPDNSLKYSGQQMGKFDLIKEESNDINEQEQKLFKEVNKKIDAICDELAISNDPYQWSCNDVYNWVSYIINNHNSNQINTSHNKIINVVSPNLNLDDVKLFLSQWNGSSLCRLTYSDFEKIAPSCGEFIFPELELWKNASYMRQNIDSSPLFNTVNQYFHYDNSKDYIKTEVKNDFRQYNINTNKSQYFESEISPNLSLKPHHQPFTPDHFKDNITTNQNQLNSLTNQNSLQHGTLPEISTLLPRFDDVQKYGFQVYPNQSAFSSSAHTMCQEKTLIGTPGKHGNHLWQFLRDLLLQPHLYENCIRWVNKSEGIFKIEDSIRVAKLWGEKKNRPAMNYDKLSRSIRQYYKKGIIKKTYQSKRLVYQFCPKYT